MDIPTVFAPSKEVSHEGQGLTAVEKIFNKNAVGTTPGKILHAGSDVRVEVNIVGSQDTTGLMTAQELESMAAKVISPIVDGAYQSGCHTASVWDKKAQANIPKLMQFMNDFGLFEEFLDDFLAVFEKIYSSMIWQKCRKCFRR
jgi:aconitate hydratase 2/2-methylisocitrate dehydratase